MKVLILNLPVPDSCSGIQIGSHQIFYQYLSTINSDKNIEIVELDREVVDCFNNEGIIHCILEKKPDIVSFSSFLWNIDRNIFISSYLRKYGIKTIAGGPEIKDRRYEEFFDILIDGQGEPIFFDIVKNFEKFEREKFIKSPDNFDINQLIVPFLEKNFRNYKLFYLEIERGCPYNCYYCAYSNSLKKINRLSDENFEKAIDLVFEKDIERLYLLAPTLNYNVMDFKKKLKYIASKKRNISIFGELRFELIDDETLHLMKKAKFDQIEIGVQSLNINTNKNSGRVVIQQDIYSIRKNIIKKIKKIIDSNIKPIIDFIIGLPGEKIEDIIETIEFLDKNDLLKYTIFYHLLILPGTEFEKISNQNGFLYMKKSPHLLLQNGDLDINDIKKIYYYLDFGKSEGYFTEITISDENMFFHLPVQNKEFLNSFFYHTASIIFRKDWDDSILKVYEEKFNRSPEIFHLLYFVTDSTECISYLKELKIIFSKYRNYYDNYREALCFKVNDIFSKQIIVLIPYKSISDKIVEEFIMNDFIVGIFFDVFSGRIKNDNILFKISYKTNKIIDKYELEKYIYDGKMIEKENREEKS